MTDALGFWSLVLGYALVYTGVAWFLAPDKAKAPSLAASLGISGGLVPGVTGNQQSPTGSTSQASSTPGVHYA